jgi:tetratricopeptide (TPR) repeat protein
MESFASKLGFLFWWIFSGLQIWHRPRYAGMKQRQMALLGCILVIVTGVLYWPAVRSRFVVIDDDLYILDNPGVKRGVDLAGLKWAFTTTYAANWHPLTWISHQLDYSLWGTFAGGHHLTSILIHALNTLLLYLLLKRLTGSVWLSFMVAALFGWHPMHVESVAWIAERKDVLSTFFFLLTIGAYARYAQPKDESPKSKVQSPKLEGEGLFQVQGPNSKIATPRPSPGIHPPASPTHSALRTPHPALHYLLALVFFAMGLMSKPMLVSLPFVLLLLDYWPLRRFQQILDETQEAKDVAAPNVDRKEEIAVSSRGLLQLFGRLQRFFGSKLFLEKLPFFVLAVAASAITLASQHTAGAMKSVEEVPLALRTLNALSAYGHYLAGSIWPMDLCVFYPLPSKPPVISGIMSAAALVVLTCWSFRARNRQPWAVVGWLWFLGTLVPVIGLVQVGAQARADRYTYIPFIGLFIMMIWIANALLERWQPLRRGAIGLAITALCCYLGLTRHQLAYWHNSVALCRQAVAVTKDNAFAHNNLGVALAEEGKLNEATEHYAEAVRIKPNYTQARYNLGIQLASAGELEKASVQFTEALKQDPHSEILHNNLGVILAEQEKLDSAIQHFRKAIELNPQYPKPYLNYAMALQKQGEAGAAVTNYYRALALEPAWPEALDRLAFVLAACPTPEYHNPPAAVKLADQANETTRRAEAGYLDTLAMAYCAAGQFSNALATAELAQAQAIRKGSRALCEKLANDIESYRSARCPEIDWRRPRSIPKAGESNRTKS